MANPESYPNGGAAGYYKDFHSDDPAARARADAHAALPGPWPSSDSNSAPLRAAGRDQVSDDAAEIVLETLRWRSLIVWAVVVGIFYYTPLWRKATPTSIWTPVVVAVPMAALALTSPTARKYIGGCLLFLVIGAVLFVLLIWQMFPESFVRHQPEQEHAPAVMQQNKNTSPMRKGSKHLPKRARPAEKTP